MSNSHASRRLRPPGRIPALLLAIAVAACGSSTGTAPPPGPSGLASATPEGSTGGASPSPAPSLPPELAPAATVLDGVDIGAVDDFSTLDGDRWEATAVSVAGGNATIAGAPVWASGLYGRWAIEEGEGVVVRLAFQGDAEWDLGLSSGQFDSGTFRQFGFYSSPATLGRLTLETILGEESEVAEQFDPSVELEVGAAYDFLVAVAPGGEFAVAVWDPEERAPVSQKVAKGAEWAGQRWGFDIGANAGSVVVEQLAELTFTSIR